MDYYLKDESYEELIRRQPVDKLDWFWLAQSGRISESLIREYWDVIKSTPDPNVFEDFYHFSKNFMREFRDEICWKNFLYNNETWRQWQKLKIMKDLDVPEWKKYRDEEYE